MRNIVYKPIDDLIPYEKNAKMHSIEQIEAVTRSLERFGFVQPIVIDKNNVIVIGHCRAMAAAKNPSFFSQVPCIQIDDLTEDEIKALRLADNKLNESPWEINLAMEELGKLDISLQKITGFDLKELQMSFQPVEGGERLDKKKEITCPECGHVFEPKS